jgi:hypothetical protein
MSSWDQANRGEKLGLVWRIERNLAKLSMTTLTYRSSSELFYELSLEKKWPYCKLLHLFQLIFCMLGRKHDCSHCGQEGLRQGPGGASQVR